MKCVRAIVIKENRILLGYNSLTDEYGLPGGHIEEGEHVIDALFRELQEESGIAVVENVEYLFEYADNYVFLVEPKNTPVQPTATDDPDEEFNRLEWFSVLALPANMWDLSEDICYSYLANRLKKISAGVIEVLVDGKKVYELGDDEIWLTLPRLAQERTKGKKVTFRQIADDGTVLDDGVIGVGLPVQSFVWPISASYDARISEIIDELFMKYFADLAVRPTFEMVTDVEFLGNTVATMVDGGIHTNIQINEKIADDTKLLRQTLAHELIHHFLYQTYGLDAGGHDERFQAVADKINAVEGENYIASTANDTAFAAVSDYGKFHTGQTSEMAWNSYVFKARIDSGIFTISVTYAGADVAEFQFVDDASKHEGELYPLLSEVDSAHRRKGIATEAYKWAKKLTGMPLVPSVDQSQDAKKFWHNLNADMIQE